MQRGRLTLSEALTFLVDIIFILAYDNVYLGATMPKYDFVFPLIWCGTLILRTQEAFTSPFSIEDETEKNSITKILLVGKEITLLFVDLCFLNELIWGYYGTNVFDGYPAVWISLFLIASGLRVLLSIVWLYRGIDRSLKQS